MLFLDRSIHWPIIALAIFVAISYHYVVRRWHLLLRPHASQDVAEIQRLAKYRRQFAAIDLSLYVATTSIVLAYITFSLRPPTEHQTSLLLTAFGGVTLITGFVLILSIKLHLTRPRPVIFHRSITTKSVLGALILGIPALVVLQITLRSEEHLERLRNYRTIYEKQVPDHVSSERSVAVQRLYELLPALHLHYLRTDELTLPRTPPPGPVRRKLVNTLNGLSSSSAVFVARFVFYFAALYVLLRYFALRIEVRQAQRAPEELSLGLEEDVIGKVSALTAGAVAFITALGLSGVSFGEIGLFGGLVAAGVSVALRDVLANLMAGVILTWDRTIAKDDVISLPAGTSSDVASTYGIVKAMTLRYTVVEERNTVSRLIPNASLINSTVENWTKSGDLVRLAVNIGVDYKADPKRVRAILESICYEVERVSIEKRPQALITSFTESAVNFALRFWVKEPRKGIRPVLSAVYFHILERFADEEIAIAFPQLDLHLRSVPDSKPRTSGARAKAAAARKVASASDVQKGRNTG